MVAVSSWTLNIAHIVSVYLAVVLIDIKTALTTGPYGQLPGASKFKGPQCPQNKKLFAF